MIEPMLAALSWTDYLVIAAIVTAVVVGFDVIKQGSREERLRGELDRQLAPIERKLNALLKQQGLELAAPKGSPSVSPELLKLATTPGKMAEAIELYRGLCPGAGPAEAKAVIEVLAKSQAPAPQPPSQFPPNSLPPPASSAPKQTPSTTVPKATSTISPELLQLATTPGKMNAAIALYQVLCPGAGVAEAKAVIEVLAKSDPPPKSAKPETGSV